MFAQMNHQQFRRFALCRLTVIAMFGILQSASAEDVKLDVPTRRIFVPTEELDVVVERDKKGVLLPQAELKTLLDLAAKNPALKNPPPTAQLVSKCDYAARIVGDHLLLTVTADLQQLVPGWQAWTFPLQRLSVEKATLNGEPAFIGRKEDGALTLLTPKDGKYVFKLELSTEIVTLGSDQAIAFSLLGSPAGELTITLPAGKRLLLDGLQRERPAAIDQPAEYQVAIGGRPSLQLRITDRATDRKADALVFATTGYGLFVSPGEVTWHALTTLQVFGRPVDRVVCSVPGYLEIADVDATGLESWTLTDDPANPQRTLITLTFGQPLDGARKITFRGVMPAPAGTPWLAPPLTVVDATSHVGQVVLQYPVGVRLQIQEMDGIRRATVGQKSIMDMPSDMLKANAAETLRFDAWQDNFTLRCLTQPKPRELHAAIAAVLDVASSGLSLQAALTLTPRFAPLFEVDVQLPAEWSVVAATGPDGQPLKWETIPQDAGTSQFRFALRQPIAPGAEGVVKLELRREVEGWPVEAEPIAFPLPELVLPQATLAETAIIVRGDNDLDLVAEEFVGLDPAPLKAEWERLRFQSQDTRYSGRIKTIRKPARVAAEVIGVYRLDPQTLHSELFARIFVEGGGVRRIIVSLPEAVGSDVRFELRGLVEQQPLSVEKGQRRWRLQLAERLHGETFLSTRFEMPRPAQGAITAPVLTVEETDRQFGAVVVEAGPEQQLTIDATDAQGLPLSETDPLDLPAVPYTPKERIVGAYRTVSAGAKLSLSEQRFDKSAVPTAVCRDLLVSSIVSKTGELQQKADFQLKLAGVPQLRVTLPAEAMLWAALINSQPVEVRRQGDFYVLPVSSSGGAIEVVVTLFYRSHVPALEKAGTFRQSPPELTAVSGQGQDEPIEVLEQRWDVIHPEDTLLVHSRGRLEPAGALDQPGWLVELQGLVRQPTWSSAGWGLFTLVVTVGAVAFLVLLHQHRGTRGVIEGLLVIGGFGCVSFCMYAFSAQEQRSANYYANGAKTSRSGSDLSITIQQPVSEYDFVPPTSAPAATSMPAASDEFAPRSELSDFSRSMDESKSEDASVAAKRRSMAVDPIQELERSVRVKTIDRLQDAAPQRAAVPQLFPAKEDRAGEAKPNDRDDLVQIGVAGVPILGRRSGAAKAKGLLSLSLALEAPSHSRSKSFRYLGAAGGGSGNALELDYVDRNAGSVWRLMLFVFGVFVGWLSRKGPGHRRATLLALLLAASIGLSPIAPVTWQITLDGLFSLACGAALSWGLYWLVSQCLLKCRHCCGFFNAAVMLTVLLSGSAASAQPPATKPVLPPPVQRPALIVPFHVDQDPQTADRVLLPFEKFVELYQLAHPEKLVTMPPPEAGRILEALYRAEVVVPEKQPEAANVKLNARLVLRSYVDGQWSVPLPFQNVALNSAKLNGQNAAIQVNGGQLTLIVPAAGLYVLDAEFSVPAKVLGASGSFHLAMVPTPAAQLSFALPTTGLAVRVNGSTTAYRRMTEAEKQRIELPIDRGGDLQISWQPEQNREGGAAVVHVESVTAVSVADAGVTVSAGFKYRVRQGIVRDLAFALPEGVKLQGVAGPDVGGWELVGDGAQRRLRVFLRRNVGDATELTIDTYLPHQVQATPSSLTIAEIAPLEVTAEVGHVVIYAGDQFSVRPEALTGLAQVDTANYQPVVPVTRIDAPAQLVYRFSRRPWTLQLTTSRVTSQMQVTLLQGQRISDRKVETTTRLLCDLAVVPRSALDLRIPANWVVLDVQSNGLKDWFLTPGDGPAVLTLEYDQPRQGVVEIVVLTTQSRDPAQADVALGSLSVTGAVRMQRQSAVWLDTGLNAQVAALDKWKTIDAAAINPHFQQLQPTPAHLAFESSQFEPGEVTLTLNRATPRLLGESLTSITVTDVAVVYGFVFQWKIDQATADRLIVDTPAELAGKLDFQGTNLRDVATTVLPDGRLRWTLALRSPVMGQFKLTAAATLPPQTGRIIAPGLLFVGSDAATTPLETQRHYVLLVNTSLNQLSATDASVREPVQREDVSIVVRKELTDQATEFVRVKTAGVGLAWTVQRYTPTAGIPASVNLADLTMILARDGSYRAQAAYTLKNRSRQFLAVKLPKDSRLLSVFVGNQPSRTVLTTLKEEAVHLVALPKTSAADLSFRVTLTLSGRLDKALPFGSSVMGRDLDLPAPMVVGQDESPEFGIPVARTRWAVYVPDDLDVWPVRDPKRNNLNDRASELADTYGARAVLQDYAELLSNYDSLSSERSRFLCASNLKQLDTALQTQNPAVNGGDVALTEEYRKLQTRYQTIVQQEKQQQQPIAQGGPEGVRLNINPNGKPQSQDVQQQLGNAVSNNTALFFDNGLQRDGNVNGILDGSAVQNFNFIVVDQPGLPGMTTKSAEQAASQAQQALKNSGNLDARNAYRSRNDKELLDLNRDIAGKKLSVQQGQSLAGNASGLQGGSGAAEWRAFGRPTRGAAAAEGLQLPQSNTPLISNAFNTPGGEAMPAPGPMVNGPGSGILANGDLTSSGTAPLSGQAGMFGGMGAGGFGGGGALGLQLNDMDGDGLVQNAWMDQGPTVSLGAGWKQSGGLSLDMALPTSGQRLVFGKSGGDARLALTLRPRRALSLSIGVVWTLCCLALAGVCVLSSRHPRVRRMVPLLIAGLAAIGVVVLVGPLSGVAFVVFLAAATNVAWTYRHTAAM